MADRECEGSGYGGGGAVMRRKMTEIVDNEGAKKIEEHGRYLRRLRTKDAGAASFVIASLLSLPVQCKPWRPPAPQHPPVTVWDGGGRG